MDWFPKFTMSGGGGCFGGHVAGAGHIHGYPPNWMKDTEATLAQELRDRGIEPPKYTPPPTCFACALIAGLMTALILNVVFWIIWENT